MLNAGLLIDDSNTTPIYDYKTMQFNSLEYNRRLNEWIAIKGYSDILKAIVMNLYSISPENRITHEELWGMVK